MTLSKEERKVLQDFEAYLGEPIPEVNEIHRYEFGCVIKEGHVKSLSLFSCNLYSIPENINNLSQLEELYLRGNKLKIIPEELCFIAKWLARNVIKVYINILCVL